MLLRAIKFLAMSFFIITHLQGQTGYMGKFNELQLDVFDLAYSKTISFQDKILIKQNTAIGINFGKLSSSADITIPDYKPISSQTQYEATNVPSHVDFKATRIGVNIYKNMSEIGMPLPLGWYYYYGVDVYRGKINSTVNLDNYTTYDSNGQPIIGNVTIPTNGVSYTGVGLKFGYGRDWYLYKNLTLDVCYEAGILSNFYYNPTSEEFITAEKFPQTALFLDKIFKNPILYKVDALPNSFTVGAGFIYILKVRIGYMF